MGVFCIKASVSISSDVTVRCWAAALPGCCLHPPTANSSAALKLCGFRRCWRLIVNTCHAITQINTSADTLQLLHAGPAVKLAACAVATAALWLTLKFGTHPVALPAMLCGIPAVFHVVRLVTGTSIAELQESGWLLQSKVTSWPCWLQSGVAEQIPCVPPCPNDTGLQAPSAEDPVPGPDANMRTKISALTTCAVLVCRAEARRCSTCTGEQMQLMCCLIDVLTAAAGAIVDDLPTA